MCYVNRIKILCCAGVILATLMSVRCIWLAGLFVEQIPKVAVCYGVASAILLFMVILFNKVYRDEKEKKEHMESGGAERAGQT